MAMVSPATKPLTGPATKEPPLREIPVQPVPQVAVTVPVKPCKVNALLWMVEPTATVVWFVKENASGVVPPPLAPPAPFSPNATVAEEPEVTLASTRPIVWLLAGRVVAEPASWQSPAVVEPMVTKSPAVVALSNTQLAWPLTATCATPPPAGELVTMPRMPSVSVVAASTVVEGAPVSLTRCPAVSAVPLLVTSVTKPLLVASMLSLDDTRVPLSVRAEAPNALVLLAL